MNFFGPNPTVSQAERELRPLLLDDGCQVLSTFELNKVASLTYGDLVCDEMFELIENIVAQPLNYSPLTVQKTLVVTKHILIYGSEKCVNSAYGIGKFVEGLTTFNSVLAAQQQRGANAFLQRLQGGGVDRGGPIRDAAKPLHELLKNINELQRIRNESASRDSLVPIGDDKVAFITDDVRHWILKRKIQQQEQIEIRSNLAKSEGGFGGGYMTKDGKNVVGAAHGIEEMIKMAQRDKKKFTDSGMTGPSPEDMILQELAAESKRQKEEAAREAAAQNEDLLAGSSIANRLSGDVDLLDFGSPIHSTPTPYLANTTGDLLDVFGGGSASAEDDLLGLAGAACQQHAVPIDSAPWSGESGSTNGLLAFHSTGISSYQADDPFASVGLAQPPGAGSVLSSGYSNGLGELSGLMNTISIGPSTKTIVTTTNEDRFAALDALVSTSINPIQTSAMEAKLAEKRLLADGFTSKSGTPASNRFGMGSMPLNQHPVPNDVGTSYGMAFMPSLIEPMIAPGSGQVAPAYGDIGMIVEDDNPWIMGGTSGTGLQPLGAAPASPPPPPPPPSE